MIHHNYGYKNNHEIIEPIPAFTKPMSVITLSGKYIWHLENGSTLTSATAKTISFFFFFFF